MAGSQILSFIQTPYSARFRFKIRGFTNTCAVVGIFLCVSYFASSFEWWWIADAVLIGTLYYFFFHVWSDRAIGIRCPHCRKYIATNTPWVCGVCGHKNLRASEFPFVYHCENPECCSEPKIYKCHHEKCGLPIFLSSDHDEKNFSYSIHSSDHAPAPDERTTKLKTHQDEKENKSHELMIAEMDDKLKVLKDRIAGPKIKTPYQRKQEDLDDYLAGVMGAKDVAAKQKTANAETFRDDPENLRDANAAVDRWLKRNI